MINCVCSATFYTKHSAIQFNGLYSLNNLLLWSEFVLQFFQRKREREKKTRLFISRFVNLVEIFLFLCLYLPEKDERILWNKKVRSKTKQIKPNITLKWINEWIWLVAYINNSHTFSSWSHWSAWMCARLYWYIENRTVIRLHCEHWTTW